MRPKSTVVSVLLLSTAFVSLSIGGPAAGGETESGSQTSGYEFGRELKKTGKIIDQSFDLMRRRRQADEAKVREAIDKMRAAASRPEKVEHAATAVMTELRMYEDLARELGEVYSRLEEVNKQAPVGQAISRQEVESLIQQTINVSNAIYEQLQNMQAALARDPNNAELKKKFEQARRRVVSMQRFIDRQVRMQDWLNTPDGFAPIRAALADAMQAIRGDLATLAGEIAYLKTMRGVLQIEAMVGMADSIRSEYRIFDTDERDYLTGGSISGPAVDEFLSRTPHDQDTVQSSGPLTLPKLKYQ